jgi:hypothetical protein
MTLTPHGGGGTNRFIPWIIFGVFLAYVAAATLLQPSVRSPEGFNLAEFGRVPVLMNGRVQPLDSVARYGLLQVRGTVTVPLENTRSTQVWRRTRTLSATEWLLELLTKPDTADARRIFPVQDPTLLRTLGLQAPPGSGPDYYTFKQLQPTLNEVRKQTLRITKINATNRAAWERECLKLGNALVIYERLKNSLQPNTVLQRAASGKPIAYDFAALLARYQTDLRAGVVAAAARGDGKKQELDKQKEEAVRAFARPYVGVSRAALVSIIPPVDPARSLDGWQNIGTVLVDSARTGQLPATVAQFAAMSSAFAQGKSAIFNGQVISYRQWLTVKGLDPEVSKANYEFLYNRFQPFVRATAIYAVGFVLVCASWFKRSPVLYRSAAMVVVLAYALHTAGLMFDVMIEGLPAVTNVYASMIYAGWGVALLGGAVERVSRNSIGMATAALGGLMTLAVADSLALGGAMELMRAMLDMGFCLATVATIIALGVGRYAQPKPVGSQIGPRSTRRKRAARSSFGTADQTQTPENVMPQATVGS